MQLTRRDVVVRGAAALGGLAAGSVLAGCGGAGTAGPATRAGRFENLNIGVSAPPSGLDPGKGTASELLAFQEMFEPLINRMPDRSLVPALAAGPLQRLNATTWRATLRAGRTFTDGSPITAQDVKFSFDRILDPSFASPYLDYLSFFKEVRVVDSRTVEFLTTGPVDIVPDRVAIVRVVPMAVVMQKGDREFSIDPGVGSGSMVNSKPLNPTGTFLKAYDGYNGVLPVYTDTAAYLYVPDVSTRIAQLKSGEISIAGDINPPNYRTVQSDQNLHLGITPLDTSTAVCTGLFNCGKKPFSDIRVRQAFMYGLDRDQLVRIVNLGYARVADSPLPEANPYHVTPSVVYDHDPERSKSLLKAAGYGSGLTFELNVSNISPTEQYAPLLQQQLAQAGFNPLLRIRGIDDAFPEIFAGNYESFVFPQQFEAFSYDVDMLIRGWWGGFYNQKAAFWTTPGAKSIPGLLDAALVAESETEKKQLYGRAQQIIVAEAAIPPLIILPTVTAWSTDLAGFTAPYTWIDPIYLVRPRKSSGTAA